MKFSFCNSIGRPGVYYYPMLSSYLMNHWYLKFLTQNPIAKILFSIFVHMQVIYNFCTEILILYLWDNNCWYFLSLKNTHSIVTHICGIEKIDLDNLTYKAETDTDVENRRVDLESEAGGGGMSRKSNIDTCSLPCVK